MKLIIDEFGPINQKSEIDLDKRFTLFVGENNSGKTYVSQLIYGIYNNRFSKESLLLKEEIAKINNIKENKPYKIEILKEIFDDIINSFLALKNDTIIKYIFKIDMNFNANLEYCYDKFVDDLEFKEDISLPFANLIITKDKKTNIINFVFKDINYSHLDFEENLNIDLELKDYFQDLLILFMKFKYFNYETIYLPASRTFLAQFYKQVYTLEKEYKEKIVNKYKPENLNYFKANYTRVIDNIIKRLTYDLKNPQDNIYLQQIAKIMEGDVIVNIAEGIGMADMEYKSGENNLPLYLSSSMANQLTLLYMYFKYWIRKANNFLIIDEPEINLHPSKKVELLKLLLKFASDNSNKVLVTTHSTIIAEELSNYIMMLRLKESGKDIEKICQDNELDMDTNISLNSKDIGIYYFNGNSIIEYESDEYGLHFGTFTKVKDEIKRKEEIFSEYVDE